MYIKSAPCFHGLTNYIKSFILVLNEAASITAIYLNCGFGCHSNVNASFYYEISEKSLGNEQVAIENKYENSVR